MSKWIKKIENQDEADALAEARKEDKRLKNLAWCKANRDKMNAYKRKTRERARLKKTVNPASTGYVVKSTYRPNWKESPVYDCPELTYRGKAT